MKSERTFISRQLCICALTVFLTLQTGAAAYGGTIIKKNARVFSQGAVYGTEQERTIPVSEPVDGETGAAAAVAGEGNVAASPYYRAPDYYAGNITATLVLLPKFRTYQQTSERSCGAACVLMGLNRFGITDVSEAELDREMDIRYINNPQADGSYGASTDAVAGAFTDRGFTVQSSRDTAGEDGITFPDEENFAEYLNRNLRAGNLLLTESVEWGGHWMVLIGYDSMGTENYEDDVLVFADPYDTTDQCQDGYLTRSFERYFATWFDHAVMPPDERVQQYVLVLKK